MTTPFTGWRPVRAGRAAREEGVLRRVLPLALAMLLALVPVTLVVPLLHELLVVRFEASPLAAHLFMSVNMMAGVLAAPVVVRLARGRGAWLFAALAVDAGAFWLMGRSESMPALFGWRVVEGAAHLSAVTLLFAAANRLGSARRGVVMGLMGASLTLGVGLGAPLGGLVGTVDPGLVFPLGAAILLGAAVLCTPAGAASAASDDDRLAPAPDRSQARPVVVALPLAFGFSDRFCAGVFASSFMLYAGQTLGLAPTTRGTLMMLFMVPFALSCCPAGILADRMGRALPLALGAAGFGVAFALYGVVPAPALPALMVASGLLSALKFAPTLALCGEIAAGSRRDGMFAAFNVAGSLGFLLGPLVGGLLAQWSVTTTGAVNYRVIFLIPATLELLLAVAAGLCLRKEGRVPDAPERRRASIPWLPTS